MHIYLVLLNAVRSAKDTRQYSPLYPQLVTYAAVVVALGIPRDSAWRVIRGGDAKQRSVHPFIYEDIRTDLLEITIAATHSSFSTNS